MPYAIYCMISIGFVYPDIKLKELEQDHGLFRFFKMLNSHISIIENMTETLLEPV